MQRLSLLYEALNATPSTRAKVTVLVAYFRAAPAANAACAVHVLSGQRLKCLIGQVKQRAWLTAWCEPSAWLVEDTYAQVGDLAETIALLASDEEAPPAAPVALADWFERCLLPLAVADEAEQQAAVTCWWR